MRALAVTCLTLASMTAFGQGQDQRARHIMAEALGQIRLHTAISIDMSGKETFGTTEVPVRALVGFQRGLIDSTQTAWIEARTFRNGFLTHRLAGDGEVVWTWASRSNEYASNSYQTIGASRNDFLSRLMSSSARWTSREADFAVRLLSDIYLGSSAQSEKWSPWIGMPSSTQVREEERSCTIILDQAAQNQRLIYELDRAEENQPWQLLRVSYTRSMVVNKKLEAVEWVAQILPGVVPEDVSYVFIPPQGSRPRASGGV